MPKHLLRALSLVMTLATCTAYADGPTLSLTEGFRTCVELYRVPHAHELMKSIWDAPTKEALPGKHAKVLQGYSFRLLEPDIGFAEAALVNASPIAGVPPLRINALTCTSGCGLSVFQLEFGTLTQAQQKRLKDWVRKAPSTPEWMGGDPLKVRLTTSKEGTFLTCDTST